MDLITIHMLAQVSPFSWQVRAGVCCWAGELHTAHIAVADAVASDTALCAVAGHGALARAGLLLYGLCAHWHRRAGRADRGAVRHSAARSAAQQDPLRGASRCARAF